MGLRVDETVRTILFELFARKRKKKINLVNFKLNTIKLANALRVQNIYQRNVYKIASPATQRG